MKIPGSVRHLDWPLLGSATLLVGLGLLVQFAINYKDPALAQDFSPAKQVFFAVIGLGLLGLFARLDFRIWGRLGKYWYGLGIFLLLLVQVVGTEAQGAVRAINLGIIQFQPTEFIKLGVVMVLSGFFIAKSKQMGRFSNFALSLAIAALPALLVAIQPDLGSAIVIMWVWLVMIFAGHVKKTHLFLVMGAGLLLVPLVFSNLHDYQKLRIQSFLNPQADPQGAGYNVTQATIAVGSGQLLGKGLGAGTQSQLNFIPSQHTDFIFAVTAEKLGLLGGAITLILFAVILVRSLSIAKDSHDRFSQLLALGISAIFFIHVVVNIGMNLGVMPVTGIPLPFLSYGGTSLIMSLIAIGILQSIKLHQPDLTFRT